MANIQKMSIPKPMDVTKMTSKTPKGMTMPKTSPALMKNVAPSMSAYANASKIQKNTAAKGIKGYNPKGF